jgi:tetratricopeptide (TPR) repeat protein
MEAVAKEAQELSAVMMMPRESMVLGVEPEVLQGQERERVFAESQRLDTMAMQIMLRAKEACSSAGEIPEERGPAQTASTRSHTSLWARSIGIPKDVARSEAEYASILNDQALNSFSRGRHIEAQVTYSAALALRREALPTDHPQIGASHQNLASVALARGRADIAEPHLVDAHRIQVQSLSEDDITLDTTRYEVAELYRSMGRYGEAERTMVESVQANPGNVENQAFLDLIRQEKPRELEVQMSSVSTVATMKSFGKKLKLQSINKT